MKSKLHCRLVAGPSLSPVEIVVKHWGETPEINKRENTYHAIKGIPESRDPGRKGGTQRWDAKVGRKGGTQRCDAKVGRK